MPIARAMLAPLILPYIAYTLPLTPAARVNGRAGLSVVAMAEGGPPQIDWQDAKVAANVQLSRGTMQLTVEADNDALDYKPGHILGFEIAHPESGEGLKGPYTVTRSSGTTFDVIYRVIPDGRKTPFMEGLEAGAPVRFGGRFGVPVAEGIQPDVDRVVGIATGAGVGPLVGYAEAALASSPECSIELYGGFRDLVDVCCKDETSALAASHANFRFTPVISRPMACTAVSMSGLGAGGASSSSITGSLGGGLKLEGLEAPAPAFVQGRVGMAVPGLLGEVSATTHFHLVGNGQFVVDMQAGLLAAGVAEGRITTEKYFNGKAEPDEAVVEFIANALKVRVAAA